MSDPAQLNTGATGATGSPPSTSAETPKEVPVIKPRRKLPAWLDHFNARDLKVLFRCAVAAWVASLLIFIGPSLRTLSTATFFATLVLFMVPPNGIVFIFILGSFTLILGMASGWAWGVITMKAALAARPAAETNSRLMALAELASNRANSTGLTVTYEEEVLLYSGYMLDARVSAVYFCMICFLIYLLARIRAKNPKFILFQIFGTIIMDIFLTVGPLLPAFEGTIAKVLVEPAAIGVGLGLACQILLFPKSTSCAVLEGMEGLTRLLKGPLDVTSVGLAMEEPVTLAELTAMKMKIIGTYKAIQPALGFLQLDFSVGRWGADDIKSLKKPLRRVTLATLALMQFHLQRAGGHAKLENLRAMVLDSESPPTDIFDEKKPPSRSREAGRRQIMESIRLVKAFHTPEHETRRSEIVASIKEPSKKILPVCEEANNVFADCIHAINAARWFNRPSQQHMDELLARSETALEQLKVEREAFISNFTDSLIRTNADIFDQDGNLKDLEEATVHKVRVISVCMIFEEQLIGVAVAWEGALEQLVALMKERQKIRLWLPKGLRYAVNWALRRNAVAPVVAAQTPNDPEVVEAHSKAAQQSLRISRGYRVKQRSGLGRAILGSYHWLINADGMYAMRMVIVTIALGIPAVIPSSAGFFYRQKGLWALIMGQTSLVIYMSDFTLSLVSRTTGTIIGGVTGLVAWYIGSGDGDGNSYGLAAVMAVVLTVLIWMRLFLPLALLQGTMMCGATFILVVGYSFDDTHIASYGNPGHGYSVFWRRLVLVLIGSAAALIVQLFPRPPSATRHVCKSLSNTLRSLSDHYALLLSCWGQPDRDEGLVAEELAFSVADALSALDGPVALLKLEFSSSPFDSERLAQVKALCQELNQNLARLLFLSASLPEHFQARIATRAGLLDHRNIGDVMAVLGVIEQALKTGDPLPEVLPTPLLNRSLDYWEKHKGELTLNTELMRDEDYRRFCVAINAHLNFLGAIDELVLVMKGTLGESHIVSRELMHDLQVGMHV